MTCYRCPKELCISIAAKTSKPSANNTDGRYAYIDNKKGFSNLKAHLEKCIGANICMEMVSAQVKQDELAKKGVQQVTLFDMPCMAALKARPARDKVIYEFIKMIIEKGQPISNVEDNYWRTLVYRSHGVNNISSPVCKRTVGEVILELMTRVEGSIKVELVCVLYRCFSVSLTIFLANSYTSILITSHVGR